MITTTYLATFVVTGKHSDTEAINSAVSVLDFAPVAQAANMHVFLIRSDKTQNQLAALLAECLDPADYCSIVAHPDPEKIAGMLKEAATWADQKVES